MPSRYYNPNRRISIEEYPVWNFTKAVFVDLKKSPSTDAIYNTVKRKKSTVLNNKLSRTAKNSKAEDSGLSIVKQKEQEKTSAALKQKAEEFKATKQKGVPKVVQPSKPEYGSNTSVMEVKAEEASESLQKPQDPLNHPRKLLAYVTNRGSGTVSIVDILSLKKIDDIIVGNGPFDLDISPGRKYIYVSNENDGTLSVIRINDNKVVNTIELNTGNFTANLPEGVKVSRGGRYVYVANYSSKNVSVIDAKKRRVITAIPLPSNPHMIDITKDGRFGYVTLKSSKQTAVLDLSTNMFIKAVSTGSEPADIAISPKKPLACTINEASGDITVINTKIGESSPDSISAGAGASGVTFSPNGKILYVTNNSTNSITAFDVFVHTPLFNIVAGDNSGPADVAATPDGEFIIISNYNAGTISVISTSTKQVIGTIPVGEKPFHIAVLDTLMDN